MKKQNLVLSSLLHFLFFAALFVTSSGPRKFEGYPTVMPVELVKIEPVSFKAPEVEKLEPRQSETQPQPKELEGVTIEKRKVEKKEEERPPEQKEPPKESKEGKSTVESEKVRLDVDEFPFSYYLALLRSRIQTNWEPPVGPATDFSRVATVYFRIQRNGQVTDISIEEGSGDFLFDRAALRAVTLANPLPPLPGDFPEPSLGVHFEFEQGR